MKLVAARPHRLLAHIAGEIGNLALAGERCMLLVPAQYTLQAEIELMERLNLPGSFLIDVLSPARLQSRVFERAGWPERIIFDERGKRMVLGEIIEREKDELTVYRAAAAGGASGLVSRMSALIADLKRGGKTASEVFEAAQAMQEDNPARGKLLDAARVFLAYERRMADKLADAEDVLAAMLQKLERSQVIRDQHVFVYGFDMVTPAFAQQLVQMAPLCRELTLAIETDENAAPDGRLFAAVNLSLQRLCKLAAERGVAVQRVRIDAPLDAPEDLRAMERGLFALGLPPFEGEPAHIELRAASTQRREAHLAAARMRALLLAGEDSADMAVVYPKGGGYAPLLAGILPQYGIPAYIAEKRSASAHPLCRFVISALAAVSGGWRVADVAECAQSGFLPLTREEIDGLCAYMEDFGVRRQEMRRPFIYIKGDDKEALERLNDARARMMQPLEDFAAALHRAAAADAVIEAVLGLLDGVGAFKKLEEMRGELALAGMESEAEDCAQVWNALMETLDQLHELLGGEDAQGESEDRARGALGKRVGRMLAEGLQALELSALPPADGAVICGEIGNVRTAQVRTLFALGMNDQGGGVDGGLLTPDEAAYAASATGAYLGMTPSERAALSQLDELKTLSGARGRLLVSYALADETGRALREGAAVQAMKRLFPGLQARGGLAQEEEREMLASPQAALEALAVRLSATADGKEPLGTEFEQAYAALSADERGNEALLAVTRRLAQPPERRLPGAQARALYGRPVMSVSRLETFAQCPYRHFVRYGLAPQETPEPGVDRAELGTLYHEAAERFTQAATALPEFPKLDGETCDRLMDEAVRPLIEAWRQSPLGASERGAALSRRIARTARRAGRNILSQFSGGAFRPMKTEFVFGQNGVAPLTLELADGSHIYLQGRIDRVDALDGEGRVIRVIDYKSGAKKFDPTMAYWGLQLQLLLYLTAALERLPGSSAAGFFYCRIADPTIKTEARLLEEVEKQIAKKLSLAGVSLSDVQILRAHGGAQAAMIAKGGQPSARHAASLADAQTMDAMIGFAKNKATALAGEAYAGVIDDLPVQYQQVSACGTCRYGAVCGFDPQVRPRKTLKKKTIEDLKTP